AVRGQDISAYFNLLQRPVQLIPAYSNLIQRIPAYSRIKKFSAMKSNHALNPRRMSSIGARRCTYVHCARDYPHGGARPMQINAPPCRYGHINFSHVNDQIKPKSKCGKRIGDGVEPIPTTRTGPESDVTEANKANEEGK